MSAQKHPYHLVNPSPWPIVTSFSLLVLVVGGALALHKEPFGLLVVAAGVLLTGLAAAFWWRDVIHEGWADRAHTPAVQRGLRLGMALFIISEVMFFAAFFGFASPSDAVAFFAAAFEAFLGAFFLAPFFGFAASRSRRNTNNSYARSGVIVAASSPVRSEAYVSPSVT